MNRLYLDVNFEACEEDSVEQIVIGENARPLLMTLNDLMTIRLVSLA